MRLLTTLMGLVVVVSCADVESDVEGVAQASETDAEHEHEELCDGSDALRFIVVTEGGGTSITPYYFTEQHGHSFFAIDGKCRYYAEDDYMRGVFSGTLTPEDAKQLSADMHWDEVDDWVDLQSDGSCFDASTTSLIKPNAAVGCYCACRDEPLGLSEALRNTTMWLEKLLSQGDPLDGPVGAVVDTVSHGGPPEQPIQAWPLERSIDSIPDLQLEPLGDPRLVSANDRWARFDDPAEYAPLRELRAEALKKMDETNALYEPKILLEDGGKLYDLFVRDELPEAFERAWKDLRSSAMSTQ